jgi:hypothetical protein
MDRPVPGLAAWNDVNLPRLPYINRARQDGRLQPQQKGREHAMARYDEGPGFLSYLFRFLMVVILVVGLGFVAYSLVGDLARPASPRIVPVTLGGG